MYAVCISFLCSCDGVVSCTQMKEEAVIINARTGEFVEEYNMDKASRVTLARKKFVTIKFRNHTPSIARLWFQSAHHAALWHDRLSSCLDNET